MKHNWTYRPFMECIENVKYTTKLQTKDFAQQGTYPVISQDESYISGYWNNAEDVFHTKRPLVIFGDHTRVLKYIDFDFVLGADGVKILLPTEDILAKYLYYYLKWYNVPSLGYSRHFKLLRDIELPIPSLDEQQAIVRELDGINRLIDLQEEQLREYDRLAQSLFYSTFGDPVSNPKGWEVKKFADAFKLKSGDGLSAKSFINGPYPVYGGNGISGNHNTYNLDGEFIIIGRVGALCGNVRCVSGQFWLTDNAFQLFYDKGINNTTFLEKLLEYLNLNQYANHSAQPVISNVTLKDVKIIFPPLSLQQSFASQIEAIEQQKALIRRSLDETRTLLAARMQYYFE